MKKFNYISSAKKTFKNGIISMYEGALQKYGVPLSMVGNGLEEVATQATQNVVNGESWNQGLTDSFLAGIGGGTLYGAPVNLSKIPGPAATSSFLDNSNNPPSAGETIVLPEEENISPTLSASEEAL